MIKGFLEFDGLSERLQTIEELIKTISKKDSDNWITNDGFCKQLSISHKTAQTYRDKGLITFSQIGNKIFYKDSDINAFLSAYSIKRR